MENHFSVILPLRRRASIDPGDLITEIRLFVEDTGATVRIDPRIAHQAGSGRSFLSFRKTAPETIAFELDGVRVRVTVHFEPFADKLEMGRYVNPVMWDHGLGEFSDHRAYIRIAESGIDGEDGPDAIFDRAAAVTATGFVLARLSEPVGAIWTAARNSVPLRVFGAALEDLKSGRAPLDFWLRWHVVRPAEFEDLHNGLVTGGLAPFIGRELMAKPSTAETRVMIDHSFALARRLIDDKLEISAGQLVEGKDRAKLRVITQRSDSSAEPAAWEIDLVDKPATSGLNKSAPIPSLDDDPLLTDPRLLPPQPAARGKAAGGIGAGGQSQPVPRPGLGGPADVGGALPLGSGGIPLPPDHPLTGAMPDPLAGPVPHPLSGPMPDLLSAASPPPKPAQTPPAAADRPQPPPAPPADWPELPNLGQGTTGQAPDQAAARAAEAPESDPPPKPSQPRSAPEDPRAAFLGVPNRRPKTA